MDFFKLAKGRARVVGISRQQRMASRHSCPSQFENAICDLDLRRKASRYGVASELESAFRRLPPLQSRSEPGRDAGVCKATIPLDAGGQCDAGNHRYFRLLSSSGMEGNGAQERFPRAVFSRHCGSTEGLSDRLISAAREQHESVARRACGRA
jgi:hypothetical protein